MNQDNINYENFENDIHFTEAGLDNTTQLVELYGEEGDLLEVISANQVVELLELILEDDLDTNANKFGVDAGKYWKVVALRIAAKTFLERKDEES